MQKKKRRGGPDLTPVLTLAVGGKTADLFRELELRSGLPGPRMNTDLAIHFAFECQAMGQKADALVEKMASLPADEARGASPKEFLVVCGVLAMSARAASKDASDHLLDRTLAMLEERADDLRFRVREAIPHGLGMIGSTIGGDALADRVEHWMDRYFHAAAVLVALSQPDWLERFAPDAHAKPLDLLEAAFFLAHDAPRSAVRYPGHKALVDALMIAPKALAKRFGTVALERLRSFAERVTIPEMREVILANLTDPNMKKPFADDIQKIRDAVEASKKPPRDPTRIVQGTRGRGRAR